MKEIVRKKLIDLVENYGRLIYREDKKLEGLLKDICGEHKSEIKLIISAVRDGIASEMLNLMPEENIQLLFPRLVKKLTDDYINIDAAIWVVDSIGLSLRIIGQADIIKLRPSGQSAQKIPTRSDQASAIIGNTKKNINIDLGDNVSFMMMAIPAGTFSMGSLFDTDENPVHDVMIMKDYYMGKVPVTQAVWKKFFKSNPSKFKNDYNPVENISWNNCQNFIESLNSMKLVKGVFRLPSEAEWEYACRAGTSANYYWGNDMDHNNCWFDYNSNNMPHPVGEKKPNAFGLYDMLGNVFEWCSDWYGANYYKKNTYKDPMGPASGNMRVIRGGCWNSIAANCRSSYRNFRDSPYKDSDVGLRLALSYE